MYFPLPRLAYLGLLSLTLLSACQSTPLETLPSIQNFDSCLNLSLQFRETVSTQAATNASAPALPALPLFHQNRFINHLAGQASSEPEIQEWFQLASTLGSDIRQSENQNLPTPWTQTQLQQLNDCAETFSRDDSHASGRRQLLTQLTDFPDHYRIVPQWLGFNGLLRPIFKWRIGLLHKEEKRLFQQHNNLAETVSYGLDEAGTDSGTVIQHWFNQAYENSPLSLPVLTENQLETLFKRHAPNLSIELEADNDQIGSPTLHSGKLKVDTRKPVSYILPSFTEFAGERLLQLNYVFWFSERRPRTFIDLYSGAIDSLIWRVTLDKKGQVLLYDSIHSCGCYHKYFIASDLVTARPNPLSKEPANIFELSGTTPDSRIQLQLTGNEHYVVGANYQRLENKISYQLENYTKLSNLDDAEAKTSLFSPTGIIKGSERLERFTLWPTGIESVGAMRQWGTHATGFVDVQHFDDPKLLNSYFIRVR